MANLITILEQLKIRFDHRNLEYMQVHKAKFILQLKDKETGEIELHELDYLSKDAENLIVKQFAGKTAFNPS